MERTSTTTQTADDLLNCVYFYGDGDDVTKCEANFKSPTKRSFLNECIRQIYILNGKARSVPVTPSPIEFDQAEILQMLNVLVSQPLAKGSDRRSSMERVRRQLFREPKRKSRKCRLPVKRPAQPDEVHYFKGVRSQLGVRKLRRHYMEEPRQAKRKCTFDDRPDGAMKRSFISEPDTANAELADRHLQEKRKRETSEATRQYRKAKRLQHLLMEKQYRSQLYLNERMLEESLRSLFYMKALLNLVVDQEEAVFVV